MLDAQDSKEYRWECPYTDCKYFVLQYVSEGFEDKISKHRNDHLERMKAERAERELKLKAQELKRTNDMKADKVVVKDYNKLHLTIVDAGFFMTRRIKIDEDCIVNAS